MADQGSSSIPRQVEALAVQWTRLIPHSSRRAKVDARRLVIDGGATWSRAILCERSGGRITIVRVCDETTPTDGELAKARDILGVAGVPSIVALAREESLIGRVELPSDDEAELRSMARMALVRTAFAFLVLRPYDILPSFWNRFLGTRMVAARVRFGGG